MNIPDVPDSIPHAEVMDMLTALGLPVGEITSDGVVISRSCIKAKVYALNERGSRYVDWTKPKGSQRIATHDICIPIADAPQPLATEQPEE